MGVRECERERERKAGGESRREAQNPNKPEACMAWARGGCVGAKGASPEIGDGRWEIDELHLSGPRKTAWPAATALPSLPR